MSTGACIDPSGRNHNAHGVECGVKRLVLPRLRMPEGIVPERDRTRENIVLKRVGIPHGKSHQNRNDDESKRVSKKITVGAKTGTP
jgi:hypothetical protein